MNRCTRQTPAAFAACLFELWRNWKQYSALSQVNSARSGQCKAAVIEGRMAGDAISRFSPGAKKGLIEDALVQPGRDHKSHAIGQAFDLASYQDVKAHAAAICDRIRGMGTALMPPPPLRGEGPWPPVRNE